ncbi:MAG: ATP-binding protein [Janthinobacterium lividum]
MILKVSLDLPGDGSYLRIARRVGHTLLEDLGVTEGDIADIEFIVGELCTNVVRHAQTLEDGRFTVTLEYYSDKVAVLVEDKGIGFPFKDVREAGSARPDRDGSERLGGFGLELVRKLADHIEFQRSDPHGTTVTAEKTLHYNSVLEAQDAERLDQENGGQVSVSSGQE